VDAWDAEQVATFLAVLPTHRWGIAFRLGVLYGLRRSEALALRWNDLDASNRTLRIDEGLVAVRRGAAWTAAKNERSRRVIPLDDETSTALVRHKRQQTEERLAVGPAWEDNELVIATHFGRAVMPRNLDRGGNSNHNQPVRETGGTPPRCCRSGGAVRW
jgi:integrase